ncbi:MAG TPA: ceramide glucosyltransferase, partial [Polyangiaceae bacterium]|nr:ceramide glucosyltransferase [Polyangiaceae bacterium]
MAHFVILLLVLGALSLLVTVVSHAAVAIVTGRRPEHGPLPSISVLKPVKGLEPGLYQNLAALARQDYPNFELLIGAEDLRDPALGVARKLQRDFPEVRISVLSGARELGYNPKVSNLNTLSECAEHDWILISDSSVRPDPQYLRAMAAELSDPKVGLVSSVLVGFGGRGPGAVLDNLLLNTLATRAICTADVLVSHSCVVGKSMLFRLSELRRLGGFAQVKDVLAEDYVLGRMFQKAGFRVALSGHCLPTQSSQRTLVDFCARHLRWAQMRRWLSLGYWAEPLLTPVPWFGIALLLTLVHPMALASSTVCGFALAGLLLRACSDALLLRMLTRR